MLLAVPLHAAGVTQGLSYAHFCRYLAAYHRGKPDRHRHSYQRLEPRAYALLERRLLPPKPTKHQGPGSATS